MNKLTLNFEELRVTSFDTQPGADEVRGTVLGHSDSADCSLECTYDCSVGCTYDCESGKQCPSYVDDCIHIRIPGG